LLKVVEYHSMLNVEDQHARTRHAADPSRFQTQVSFVGVKYRPIQQRYRSPIRIVQLGQELADASTGLSFRIFPSRERRPSVATATPPLSRRPRTEVSSHWFTCNMPHAEPRGPASDHITGVEETVPACATQTKQTVW